MGLYMWKLKYQCVQHKRLYFRLSAHDLYARMICNYFDHYLCSPLTEIGGDHPENCCFGLMIVLPVPSCSWPSDYIRRCNR